MKIASQRISKSRTLMFGASIVALAISGGHAFAQEAAPQQDPAEGIVVTGTRIVSNATSAVPITAVSTEQLQATTPSNIPDALNKLPVFQGSNQPTRPGSGGTGGQNILALRGFGAQRTLVLVDGHRTAPSNPSGTTDIDTLPQMLVSRVDVTTGGASAVYGSDAVTGVVNFILDKNFTGVKFEASGGISKYWDGESGKFGIAAGTSILGGRGHIEGSFRYRRHAHVGIIDRPDGRDVWVRTGNGTEANPFVVTKNARTSNSTYGGLVQNCTSPCPGNGMNFVADGILGPYNEGALTGTKGRNSGGDGAYAVYSDAFVNGRNTEAFGRFSYDFDNGINFFLQGSYAQANTFGRHFPQKLTPNKGEASIFFKNNAFLSADTRALLGNNGLSDASNTFQLGTYFVGEGIGDRDVFTGTRNNNKYMQVQTGLNGMIGDLRWDVFYTHGRNVLEITVANNQNFQKEFAALDAVAGPNGTVQCYAATQAATAAAYADCVPLNAFGPTAVTSDAYYYFINDTHSNVYNTLDDIGGTVTGSLFDTWAGPVDFALSAEWRWNKYKVRSDQDPTALVDCTGLRLCSPIQLWAQPVDGSIQKSSDVKEIAGELSIPLLQDAPLAQSFTLDLAGRYTSYSVSGDVQTWKVGFDWAVNNWLRFRGTASRDIRAPTLDDLYRPTRGAVAGYTDLHTSRVSTVYNYTEGNPNLVPEVARAYTAGAVLTPDSLLPGFNASVDWYKIRMDNAIGQISAGSNAIQTICEDSNGTSEYCSLYERPLPFSDRSPANYPTKLFSRNLNTALTEIEGFDFEASYRFDALGGAWSTRVLANYQPTNRSQSFPGAPIAYVASPKTRVTAFVSYEVGAWTFGIQDRWLSKYDQRTSPTQVYLDPWVEPYNSLDLSIQWDSSIIAPDTTFFVTVENAFNAKGEIVGGGNTGGGTPYENGYMGRYYTLGVRGRF